MRFRSITLLGAIVAVGLADAALAQERELRAISAFAEQTNYTRGLVSFIERVNEAGKGSLRIRFVGGPKAMPPFEVALR